MRKALPNAWTDAQDDELRALWRKGVPTLEIGIILGRSYDAVKQRARILDLPKRFGGTKKRKYLRVRGERRKVVPHIAMLEPRGGKFDSSRALSFLVDHWRKAA